MPLVVQLLDTKVHARKQFCNIDPSIELFLQQRANKEHKLKLSDTFVVVHRENASVVLGYFTLSNHSMIFAGLPSHLAKSLPHYHRVGTVLLGRLGRDTDCTPPGFGAILLKEAIKQSLHRGSFFGLELHAKNEKLVDYYRRFGFVQLQDDPNHMFMSFKTIEAGFAKQLHPVGLTAKAV